MDSSLPSSPSDSGGAKAAFRKPSNDAANRKYRRRSPADGSSSSDGSPNRERTSSPIPSREDAKSFNDRRRRDDGRDSEREYGRSQYGRTGDSYRHSDWHSSRGSHDYHRHDGYRRGKHADEDERKYSKLSSRSGRESRDGTHSEHMKRESGHTRSRDHLRDADKNSSENFEGSGQRSRDKDREALSIEFKKNKDKDSSCDRAGSGRRQINFNSEEVKYGERDKHKRDGDGRGDKRDYRRSGVDQKNDHSPTNEEARDYWHDSTSRKDSSGHRLYETSRSDSKELDGQKYPKEEKKKYDDHESDRHKERYNREISERSEDVATFTSEDQGSHAKKPKLVSLDRGTEHGKKVSKFSTIADERKPSDSLKAQDSFGIVTSEQDFLKDSDIDAAKVAAMKAAELVNRNLVGTGYMSADQKKKLLWGNKKSTTVEESTHRWDTSLFSDRERQEKFNKLMGVKGEAKVEHKPDAQGGSGPSEKQNQLQLDLEKQYTAGLRRRDGRTVGLGL